MPSVPLNRLRAFRARKGKSSAPTIPDNRSDILIDGAWIFAPEVWVDRPGLTWVWRRVE